MTPSEAERPAGVPVHSDRVRLLARLPLNGLLLDLALIAWAIFLHLTVPWLEQHLLAVFRWVWLLHCLTLYSVLLGFVLTAPQRREGEPDRVLLFVLAAGFVGILGPIWMFFTPVMLMSRRAFSALFWNTAGALAGCIIVCLVVLAKRTSGRVTRAERVLQFTMPMLYLAVSEVILYATARAPSIGVGPVITGMAVSYIPFRLIMIFTPPRSGLEVVTASAAFAYFIYVLV